MRIKIQCLEALDGEPLADIIHDEALEDDLVAAFVHTDLCVWVSHQQICLQSLLFQSDRHIRNKGIVSQAVHQSSFLISRGPTPYVNKEKFDAYGGVALDLADDGEGAGAGVLELGVDGKLTGLGAFYKVCPWQCGRLCC